MSSIRRDASGQGMIQALLALSLLCFVALIVLQVMEARHYGLLPWLPF